MSTSEKDRILQIALALCCFTFIFGVAIGTAIAQKPICPTPINQAK